MKRFIYVFDTEIRDKLLSENFKLLKNDDTNNIFIFENRPDFVFAYEDVKFALSDTLTF